MDKRCPRCTKTLPPSEFGPDPKSRDGLTGWCLKCHREVVNAAYRKQRDEVAAHFGGICVTCGYDTDPRALQIDHLGGDGAEQRRSSGSWRRILRSVLRDDGTHYQLLCANCNSIKRIAESERGSRVYTRVIPDGVQTKRCPKCTIVQPHSAFYRNRARTDGLSSYCTVCMGITTSASYQALRLRVIAHLGGCCKRCGYKEDDRALAIDHVAGDGGVARKAGRVHRMNLNAALTDETGRFQLLCANCNILKRFDEKEWTRTYERVVPTERIDRPDQRRSDEWRQHCSEISRQYWANNEADRERISKIRSENMKRRWASGEIPNRPKPKLQDS